MKVTSRDIMQALGIKNVKTLTRWHQAGAIPEPTIERHPDGPGTMSYWPKWVLEHCKVIKQLTDGGQTIRDIVGTFGQNWAGIAARYRRYNFAEVSARMDRDKVLYDLCDAIRKSMDMHLGLIRQRLEAARFAPVTHNIASEALDLFEGGYNPVLIFSDGRCIAVPDVIVGLHLSKHYLDSTPFLVVPLFAMMRQDTVRKRFVEEPAVLPVSAVTSRGGEFKKKAIIVGDDWNYEIKKAKSR